MKKRTWKMSASCIGCLKACPTRFRLAYVEGLRLAEDTDSQRMGTNWHGLLEVATARPDDSCVCRKRPDCPVCHGTGLVPDTEPAISPLDRAVAWLNWKYTVIPPNKDTTEWAIERVILAYSLAGWLWYYGNDEITTVAREIKFDMPLRNPETGRALPNVRMVGKIDRVLEQAGRHFNGEYKSTSKSVDSDSSFWDHLNLDTQISCYRAAAEEMWAAGMLEYPVDGTLYDVWHKPGIRPKKLTQGESAAFVKDGVYYGQTFVVEIDPQDVMTVDGVVAEVTDGAEPRPTKKNPDPVRPYAIRETPDMFGARLLADIYERPEFYFARREIARTADQIKRHLGETFHLYRIAREMERTGHWWGNESQCEATFRCSYTSICYHGVEVFDGETTPPGFKRIFDSPELPVEEE